jgi:hypothetical protein
VISAFSGIAGGDFDGVSELQADALKTAAPMAADEAARTDLLEIAPNPCLPAWSPSSHIAVRIGRLTHCQGRLVANIRRTRPQLA